METALRDLKNGTGTGNYHINIETLKTGKDTISKTLIFKNGNKIDKNYRPINLLSNIYTLLTKVLTKRLEKTLDENQPREKGGIRSRYSTTNHTS